MILGVGVGLVLAVIGGCASGGAEMRVGGSALERGDYEAALSNAEQTIERDSSAVGAYRLKATALRRMADSTQADEYIDLYRRATEAEDQAITFDPGVQNEIQSTRQELFERERRRGQKAYNQANKNNNEQRYRHAIAFYGAAGALQPDSAGPVLKEAYARLRVEQQNEAVAALERYVERADTVRLKAYKILGRLYLSQEQYDQAVDLLEPATRFYPEDGELQRLRLNAYNQAGRVDRALDAYRRQIEDTPNSVKQHYNYGALLLEAGRYDDAIVQLRRAVEIQGTHAESQYNLGAAYFNAALARDDSIAALEEREEDPGASREEQMEGLVERRRSLFEKAVPPLERARALTSTDEEVRQNACRALLVAYVQTDRPGKAAQVEECANFTGYDL